MMFCDSYVPGLTEPLPLAISATRCTRCNACAQSCPSYLFNREEMFSPRGRAQLTRLHTQGKIKTKEQKEILKKSFQSCTLCARCSAACAGQIPVAHYMLLLRKRYKESLFPWSIRCLLWLRRTKPLLFDRLIGAALWGKRSGLTYLVWLLLPQGLQHILHILPKQPVTLSSLLKKEKQTPCEKPKFLYLPSLYAACIDGEAGWKTLQWLGVTQTRVLLYQTSGLAEYLYGSEAACLQVAKKLLQVWEKQSKKPLPLVCDSIEEYSFLKNFPLLFQTLPGWKKRAEKLAAHVRFITDIPFPTGQAKQTGRTALDISSALFPATPVVQQTLKILRAQAGKNLLECEYSRFSIPAAGLALVPGLQGQRLILENVKDIAQHQIDTVYCLSGWVALELQAAMRRYYPGAAAKHLVYLQTEHEPVQTGTL